MHARIILVRRALYSPSLTRIRAANTSKTLRSSLARVVMHAFHDASDGGRGAARKRPRGGRSTNNAPHPRAPGNGAGQSRGISDRLDFGDDSRGGGGGGSTERRDPYGGYHADAGGRGGRGARDGGRGSGRGGRGASNAPPRPNLSKNHGATLATAERVQVPTGNAPSQTASFANMGLTTKSFRAIHEVMRFTHATAVQDATLPHIMR